MGGKIENIVVRNEQPGDHAAVYGINGEAFQSYAEAKLVDALRAVAEPLISLVALIGEQVVGHILFTRVTVEQAPDTLRLIGLGPMAVHPYLQERGIGSRLVSSGLDACRALPTDAVVVLGHQEYYPRFGFEPAAPHGLRYQSEQFDPHFMVQELRAGTLASISGLVHYHPKFDDV